MTAFLRGAIDLALDNHANAPRSNTQWVFFDRGLIDAAAAPQALDGTTILDTIAQSHRYHSRIFLAPPWPEIYVQDEERRHSMDEARAEFERLQRTYPALGYAVSRLPKIRVAQRADFVLDTLASNQFSLPRAGSGAVIESSEQQFPRKMPAPPKGCRQTADHAVTNCRANATSTESPSWFRTSSPDSGTSPEVDCETMIFLAISSRQVICEEPA